MFSVVEIFFTLPIIIHRARLFSLTIFENYFCILDITASISKKASRRNLLQNSLKLSVCWEMFVKSNSRQQENESTHVSWICARKFHFCNWKPSRLMLGKRKCSKGKFSVFGLRTAMLTRFMKTLCRG